MYEYHRAEMVVVLDISQSVPRMCSCNARCTLSIPRIMIPFKKKKEEKKDFFS
jgi:hypothetical protein